MAEISIENITDGFFAVKEGKLYRVEFPVNLKPSKWIDVITGNVYHPSNGDHIRSMTNKELSKFFSAMIQDCDCNNFPCRAYCKTEPGCDKAWLKWLKQEVDNEQMQELCELS